MITVKDGFFALETANTGYYMALRGTLCENLHYGAKIHADKAALCEKCGVTYGGDAIYKKESDPLSLDHLCLELSPLGKGDFRESALSLTMPDGSNVADFEFKAARRTKGSCPPKGMPGAHGGEETLALDFAANGVLVTIFYTVYPDCDVITRRIAVKNCAEKPVTLHKCMSYQLDLPSSDYSMSTFTGAWVRERHETRAPLCVGTRSFGTIIGLSSAHVNPFFMINEKFATEFTGDVYGFNLIYSGNHYGFASVNNFGMTRVAAGIQPEGFEWTLAAGESFETPEAVLTFSADGKNGMSQNMHRFVNAHITRGKWANAPRPVLANNWEATYFSFNEAKILRIAKAAAKSGVELFVLDDGWFGARDTDKAGLGDYNVNLKKLPSGLSGLCEKIKALGMDFGLWFEPENVNPDSDLYRAHPDWAVGVPGVEASMGRNQLVLDLCRKEVQDYIIKNVNSTLKSADIKYVKWDMNRPVTDAYSPVLKQQGRFAHTMVLGLYRVMHEIVSANPDILFEGCASGGNRFDLGILSYMPQIWTSDDTDAHERRKIQTGTSYGYPQSCMACHVSAVPNHQTARMSQIDARFDTAAFGVLGYEFDFTALTPAEQKSVAAQIAFYKAHRELLQYGDFTRVKSPFDGDETLWIITSKDKKHAVAGEFLTLLIPNSQRAPMRLAGLDANILYDINVRRECMDIRTLGGLINHVSPIKLNANGVIVHTVADRYMLPCEEESYTVYGDLLMRAGLRQKQRFTGTGYTKDIRPMPDFSARLYTLDEHITKDEENK